ncbi:MAG: phenylacetate--CoA ligase family protein, partial [Desulfovibrionales bacterium]
MHAKSVTGLDHQFDKEDTASGDERKFTEIRKLLDSEWQRRGEVRSRMEGAGLCLEDVESYEDFTRIPPLSKKELITLQNQSFSSLLTVPPGELSRIYMSPGPLFDPEGRDEDYWGWTEGFSAAGFRTGDLVQMTFSYHLTPAGLMLEEPLKQLGCAVIPAGPGNTDTQIQLLTRLPVTGFVGMASFLKIIADKAEKKGL